MLRGINVSGQKIIKMAALKMMYEKLKFKDIQTYIQSGNVVFRDEGSSPKELEVKISNQIKKQFGFEIPVIVMETEELKRIIENNPFAKDESKDKSFLSITFLSDQAEHINPEIIQQKQSPGEEFSVNDKAVYLYCPNGFARSKLTTDFLENKLKVKATSRNWKTSNKLLSIAENLF